MKFQYDSFFSLSFFLVAANIITKNAPISRQITHIKCKKQQMFEVPK